MSVARPHGQNMDVEQTAFGSCLDAVRTLDPTRPDPTHSPDRSRVRAVSAVDQIQTANSPSPYVPTYSLGVSSDSPLLRQVWQILLGALHAISDNDYGRPWPYPERSRLARLIAGVDEELVIAAAREARSIVQGQDRAPSITGLFEKKLTDLQIGVAYRDGVRQTIRAELAVSGGEG